MASNLIVVENPFVVVAFRDLSRRRRRKHEKTDRKFAIQKLMSVIVLFVAARRGFGNSHNAFFPFSIRYPAQLLRNNDILGDPHIRNGNMLFRFFFSLLDANCKLATILMRCVALN